jgi:hypothetical protein
MGIRRARLPLRTLVSVGASSTSKTEKAVSLMIFAFRPRQANRFENDSVALAPHGKLHSRSQTQQAPQAGIQNDLPSG